MISILKFSKIIGNVSYRPNTRGFKYQLKFWEPPPRYQMIGVDKENYLNKKSIKSKIGFLAYSTMVVPITCVGLAVWQLYRLKWKNKLLNDMKMRMFLPAVEIPEDLTDRMKMEYRKVKVRGSYDHSREMYIGPRSLIIDHRFADSDLFITRHFGIGDEPRIGYIIVTPFKLADRDVEILVNRGWVPCSKKNPFNRLEGQIGGEIEIEGIVRLKETEARFVSQGKEDSRTFKHRDLMGMADLSNTSHFYIDAVVESTVPGGPIGGQTQVFLQNNHLQYIFIWSFLAIYLSRMWYRRFILKLMN